jgi:hypothetical protein
MSHTISQKALILVHLRYGKGLQPLEALNKYGCNRLAARIRDLRRMGWDIKTTIITTPHGKRVARYTLTDPAQKAPTGVPMPGRKAKQPKPTMLTATATKHFGLPSLNQPDGTILVQPGDKLTVGAYIYPADSDLYPFKEVRVAMKGDGMGFVDVSWVKVETPFSYR